MMQLLHVALEAHNGERNHHRRYEVAVGRDLLGDWLVTIHYGRAGQGLRTVQFGGREAEPVRQMLRARLRRRLSAPKRLGCAYRTVEAEVDAGIVLEDWVPDGLIDDVSAVTMGEPGKVRLDHNYMYNKSLGSH